VVAVIFIIGMMGVGLLELFTPNAFFRQRVNGKKITIEEYNDRLSQMRDMYRQQYPDRRWMKTQCAFGRANLEFHCGRNPCKKNSLRNIESRSVLQISRKRSKAILPRNGCNRKLCKPKADLTIQVYRIPENPTPWFWQRWKIYVEVTFLRKKLEDKIKKEPKITLDSLKTEYIKDNDLLNGRIIWFDYNTIKDVSATDAEVQKYYDANKDKEFKKGPAAKLKYLAFEMKPSDKDYDTVMNMAREIRGRIVKGESFEELAPHIF
jgi:hypothetical protein